MRSVWSYPTRIVFGSGAIATIGAELRALGAKRVLVVTDAGVVRAGLHERIVASVEGTSMSVSVFDGVDGNPTEANVEDGARAFAEYGADAIVGLGGGSPMDVAKLVAVRARTSKRFEELDDAIDGGVHIPKDLPAIVTVPTTAGTGSEVGRAGVVTLRSTKRKTVIFSPNLMPRVAILDPELTLGLPALTTAATGFDALTHCVEAYFAKSEHPMADAIALAGVDLVKKHLRTAVESPRDIEARGAMMKAAMMGAVAFQKGLGACHSLAHPLSSEHGLHHGLANALCLPAVVTFNEQVIPERVVHVGLLLGGEAELGAAANAVHLLRKEVGLPGGLTSAGIREEHLPALADKAIEDACHRENPRPCTRDDLLALYRASL